MKYESEIINEILEKRGHTLSTLHYESECVEEWFKEANGAYPKICDYESEWLNYINENPIGNFPYETLTNVTEATLENVVPYAYKSAILKGQTLVNLYENIQKTTSSVATYNDEWITLKANGGYARYFHSKSDMLKPSTKYLIIIDVKENTLQGSNSLQLNDYGATEVVFNTNMSVSGSGIFKFISMTKDDLTNKTIDLRCLLASSNTSGLITFRVMFIEYQNGMENWDIPYFDGMQSVKMPVLTTSNEDGTKTNILTVNEDVTLRSNGSVCDELDLLTGKLTQRIDEDGEVLTQEVVKTVDLSVVNENNESVKLKPIEGTMHLTTSSQTIPPLFSGEIPVEAITQNLASFIEGE